jgi:hypothetical protein
MLAGCGDVGDFLGDPLKTIQSGGTLQFTDPSEVNLITIWTVDSKFNIGPQFYAYFDTILEDQNAVSPDTIAVPTPMSLPVVAVIALPTGVSHTGYNPFPYKIANITTRLSDINFVSDVDISDLALVLPQYHTLDMFRKEGGFHTSTKITSEVDSLFLPGIIVGSDSSEAVRYQHRKAFLKNISADKVFYCKVYGFNVKKNNVIKWALEKNITQQPVIDGSETIKDYLTAPSLFGSYSWTELQSDHAIEIGNHGILSEGRGQGIWFRQACLKNMSDIASDHFQFGIFWSELP